jgi:hypothetical protein
MGLAVEDLLENRKRAEGRGEVVGSLRMYKNNSWKFGVEWEKTGVVLGEVEVEEGYSRAIEIGIAKRTSRENNLFGLFTDLRCEELPNDNRWICMPCTQCMKRLKTT